MKIKLQILLLCSLVAFVRKDATAQQKTTVQGMVTDHRGKELKFATVSLLRPKDSVLVKSGITAGNGRFEMVIPAGGIYMLGYTAIGFETAYAIPFEISPGQTYSAPDVSLRLAAKQLQGVTVSSQRQLIQVKADKTVFNVQNSINATGSNGLELLQKSPGIIVDNNDYISMKGKFGVKVYVDGKLIQLGADDLAAYLKSISSNDIEAIEIISNPGARFDASGGAGIINVRLKKNTSLGTNGSVAAGMVQGVTPKANGSFNINYRNKKINIFANAGMSKGRNELDVYAPRTQKDTNYNQHLLILSYKENYNIKAGIDFFIDKKTTIGIMNTSNFGTDDYSSNGSTPIYYGPTGAYIKRLDALNAIPRKRSNITTNFNYRHADTSGREINFDADYGAFRGRAKSYQPNYYIDGNDSLLSKIITRNNTPTDIDIYTAKIDVVLPRRKNNFGYGVKFSYVKTLNVLDFFDEINGVPVKAFNRSYGFIYKENVNAGYLTCQRNLNPKWTIQSGLRIEQTNSEGLLQRGDGNIQTDNNVKRKYWDIFPSASMSWTVNRSNSLNLAYSRRVDRPNYQNLNPFEVKLDELSYAKGNSFLRPQYTDNIALMHTWKNKFNTTLEFNHIRDVATQTIDSLGNYTFALIKNLATQEMTSISINAPFAVGRCWNMFFNIRSSYQSFRGKINQNDVALDVFVYGAFTQHTFTFGKDCSAELTAFYNGPTPLSPTLLVKPLGGMDMGFQKLFLNKKIAVKITATDIFRTTIPFRASTDFGGVVLRFWNRYETRTARINFTYRFGSNKIKSARKREAGLETESKRIAN